MHKFLTAISAISLTTSAIIPLVGLNQTTTNNSNTILDDRFLLEDIENNSRFIGTSKELKYNGKSYIDETNFKYQLLHDNGLIVKKTTSNPGKIIDNYENMSLDSSQIYDDDMAQFQQVFEDPFGKVAFSQEEALNAYVHGGLVRPKYSYDALEWFDSPEYAKQAQKDKMEIKKSLYYYINGKYYNAFNITDINELMTSVFDDGYYLNANKSLTGRSLDQKEQFTLNSEKSQFKSILANDKLRSLYYNQNDEFLSKASDFLMTNSLEIKPSGSWEVRYIVNGGKQQSIKSGQSYTMQFDPEKIKFKSFSDMKSWFLDQNQWNSSSEGDDWSWGGRKYYSRTFNCIQNGAKVKINLTMISTKWGSWFSKIPKPNLSTDYTYTDKTSSTVKLYDTIGHKKLIDNFNVGSAYNINQITNDIGNEIYKRWSDYYFNNILTTFGDDNNRDFSFEDLKKGGKDLEYVVNANNSSNPNQKYLIGNLYKDKVYKPSGNSNYVSAIESYLQWLDIKKTILNGSPINIDGEEKYLIDGLSFYATKKQLDNFLWLPGNIDLRMMYSYSEKEDFSDRFGKTLANTENEAKEKAFTNIGFTLLTRFEAYDVYGHMMASEISEQDAIEQLKNSIALNSKFINKNEIDSWPKEIKTAWTEIVSDGRYVVYGVNNNYDLNKKIYFKSIDDAVNFVKNENVNSNDIYYDFSSVYSYHFNLDAEHSFTINYYDKDYNYVLQELKEFLYANSNLDQTRILN